MTKKKKQPEKPNPLSDARLLELSTRAEMFPVNTPRGSGFDVLYNDVQGCSVAEEHILVTETIALRKQHTALVEALKKTAEATCLTDYAVARIAARKVLKMR